ncbi:MAG: hypothetical protein JJT81_14135 [Rubellimicrobium sp.]|nr:hypothetical protein [Rubellimicrobium sp.]
MTNSVAIGLLVFLLGALAADWMLNDLQGALMLARRGLDLIEFLAFWR